MLAPTTRPRLVLMLSESWTLVPPRDVRALVALAAEAERAGVDGVLLGEHVALGPEADAIGQADNPRDWVGRFNQASRYPHPHPLVVLAAMAATTTSIRLIASALLSPLRHPLTLAKELAALDLVAEGRLVCMPLAGSQEEEYRALQVPFHARGAILDEQLEIWERVWRDDAVSYAGRHFAFDAMSLEPKPWRPEGPTLWTGGTTLHPRALRRTVRYASGWFPVRPVSDADLETLAGALADAGRSLTELELVGFIGMGSPFPGPGAVKALDPELDAVAGELARGISTFVIKPSQYVDDVADFGDFCRAAVTGLEARATG